MVQHTNVNCECDSLRSQLAASELQNPDLSQNCQQLETQLLETLSSAQAVIHDSPNPEQFLVSQPDQLTGNPDHRFTSRILGPTFSLRPNSRKVVRSALSSAWELWGDDTHIEIPEAGGLGLDHDAYVNLVIAFFDRL
jgi:hypothetical protein